MKHTADTYTMQTDHHLGFLYEDREMHSDPWSGLYFDEV